MLLKTQQQIILGLLQSHRAHNLNQVIPFQNFVGQNWGKFPSQQQLFFVNQRRNSSVMRNRNLNQTSNNDYKPEPMDTSSGNTILQQRKPLFTFQELFNQQISNDHLKQYNYGQPCYVNDFSYDRHQPNLDQNGLPDFDVLLNNTTGEHTNQNYREELSTQENFPKDQCASNQT